MRNATLCFLRNKEESQILLGMKKRGFGEGKWNGFGGKVDSNETIEEATIREMHEESGVKVKSLTKVGELTFIFPHKEDWNQVVHVYSSEEWEGEPLESEEMKPEWYHTENLPFDSMWVDDPHWLPLVIQDKKVRGTFSFGEDESILDMVLEEVDEL